MTQEEQYIELCKWCGCYHRPTPEEIKSGSYYQYEPQLTLDWLHEVAKKLGDKMTSYHICLYNVAGGLSNSIEATREERLEALCRILGLWKD